MNHGKQQVLIRLKPSNRNTNLHRFPYCSQSKDNKLSVIIHYLYMIAEEGTVTTFSNSFENSTLISQPLQASP